MDSSACCQTALSPAAKAALCPAPATPPRHAPVNLQICVCMLLLARSNCCQRCCHMLDQHQQSSAAKLEVEPCRGACCPAASYSPQDSTAARPAAHASHTPGRPATAAHSSSTASSIAPPPGTYDCSITHNGEAVTWSAKPGAGAAFKASARQPASQRAPPRQLPALQQQLLQELHTAPAAATRLGKQANSACTDP